MQLILYKNIWHIEKREILPQTVIKENRRKPMLFDKKILRIRNSVAPICITFSLVLFCPLVLQAVEQSYTREIVQYVSEDKVYLLENLRRKITIPSEKTIVDALLSEDASTAVSLYQKQLSLYPNPALDQISRARIAACSLVMESPAASTKPLPAGAKDTTKQERTSQKNYSTIIPFAKKTTVEPSPLGGRQKEKMTFAGKKSFTLRFGSFKNRENAETLARKISEYTPVETILQEELYRVQLKNHYASKEDAETVAKKLPFTGFVIPVI